MSFTTHASMIVRLNNPESKAWKSFFDFYAQLIRLHGKDCGVKEENLDDLIQDVMIAVSRKTPSFNYDRDKGRFRDYLKKMRQSRSFGFSASAGSANDPPPGYSPVLVSLV